MALPHQHTGTAATWPCPLPAAPGGAAPASCRTPNKSSRAKSPGKQWLSNSGCWLFHGLAGLPAAHVSSQQPVPSPAGQGRSRWSSAASVRAAPHTREEFLPWAATQTAPEALH